MMIGEVVVLRHSPPRTPPSSGRISLRSISRITIEANLPEKGAVVVEVKEETMVGLAGIIQQTTLVEEARGWNLVSLFPVVMAEIAAVVAARKVTEDAKVMVELEIAMTIGRTTGEVVAGTRQVLRPHPLKTRRKRSSGNRKKRSKKSKLSKLRSSRRPPRRHLQLLIFAMNRIVRMCGTHPIHQLARSRIVERISLNEAAAAATNRKQPRVEPKSHPEEDESEVAEAIRIRIVQAVARRL
mmetsp:Transcript_28461/g.45724  ORF Transcript_28461/g.45724 Transcript_28461/m.45724 type:complete len:241 (-) Transcript_28461:3418-4140(-)